MRKISSEFRKYLKTPRYRIVTMSADVKREALRFVNLGDVINLCGRAMLLQTAEPLDNGELIRISGLYFVEPGIVRNWGNPEILRTKWEARGGGPLEPITAQQVADEMNRTGTDELRQQFKDSIEKDPEEREKILPSIY